MKKGKRNIKSKTETNEAGNETVDHDFPSKLQHHSGEILKIATVNVNSISAAFKKGFLQYVQSDYPDIICIQETKLHENSPKTCDSYIIDGYEAYFCNCEHKKGYAGTGIYTKIKPISVRHGFDEPDGRVILMEFDKFYLVNIYGPNIGMAFSNGDYISNVWGPKIIDLMKSLVNDKIPILCGDFNIGTSALDLYDQNLYKKIMSKTKGIKNWLSELLDEGFSDVFRHLYPNKQQFTYFSTRSKMKEKGRGLRLDYFVVPSTIVDSENKTVVDVKILNGDFSDHVPSVLYLQKDVMLTENDQPITETKATIIKQ